MKHGEGPPPSPRGRIPAKLGIAERMPRKWRTKVGRSVYARRKTIVELVNKQPKQARRFRQVLRLGLERASHGAGGGHRDQGPRWARYTPILDEVERASSNVPVPRALRL